MGHTDCDRDLDRLEHLVNLDRVGGEAFCIVKKWVVAGLGAQWPWHLLQSGPSGPAGFPSSSLSALCRL